MSIYRFTMNLMRWCIWSLGVMGLPGGGGGLGCADQERPRWVDLPSLTSSVLPMETHTLTPHMGTIPLSGVAAWCWIGDPRAIYFEGQHQRTYFGYVDSLGDIHIAAWDHTTQHVSTVVIDAKLQRDDHANPSLWIDPHGRLTVFWSAHHGPHLFYRTTTYPEDISRWNPKKKLPTNTRGRHGYTYPNPLHLFNEAKFYLFWRGGDWQPNFATSPDLETWSQAYSLLRGARGRPYLKVISDGHSRIHLAYTDGHPRNEVTNSVYHVYYEAGAFWTMDGRRIAGVDELPFDLTLGTRIFDGTSIRAWIWDISLDPDGSPIITYATFPTEHEHHYRYARWREGRWFDQELTSAGGWFPHTPSHIVEPEPWYSGGIDLDPMDPNSVYLSRPVNGVFELEKWITSDKGSTWRVEVITQNSTQNNVRPVLATGPGDWRQRLLWMAGPYTHYTDYHTRIFSLDAKVPAVSLPPSPSQQ